MAEEPKNPPTPTLEAPEEKGAYNPQGTVTATHDLRVDKHEEPHLAVLEPLQTASQKKATITIPLEEYEVLSKFKDLELLGGDWQTMDVPAAERPKLEENIRTQSAEVAIGQKTSELERRYQAEREIAVKQATEAALAKSKNKGSSTKAKLAVGLCIAFTLGTGLGWVLKPSRSKNPTLDPIPGAIKTLEISPKVQVEAINFIVGQATKEIIWLTTAPADERILNAIKDARKKTPGITVYMVTDSDTEPLATEVAKRYNFTCFAVNNSLGRINWAVVDSRQIIDASTRFGVFVLQDPPKAMAVADWIENTFGPSMRITFKAR